MNGSFRSYCIVFPSLNIGFAIHVLAKSAVADEMPRSALLKESYDLDAVFYTGLQFMPKYPFLSF